MTSPAESCTGSTDGKEHDSTSKGHSQEGNKDGESFSETTDSTFDSESLAIFFFSLIKLDAIQTFIPICHEILKRRQFAYLVTSFLT